MIWLVGKSKLHSPALHHWTEIAIADAPRIALQQSSDLVEGQFTHGTQSSQNILHRFWSQSTLGSRLLSYDQKGRIELVTL